MPTIYAALAIAIALPLALAAASRARSRAKGAEGAAGGALEEEELVAVIAAAIAAASGMEPGSFRISGISPSEGGRRSSFSGRPGGAGLNTPVWGHVDRFARGEQG